MCETKITMVKHAAYSQKAYEPVYNHSCSKINLKIKIDGNEQYEYCVIAKIDKCLYFVYCNNAGLIPSVYYENKKEYEQKY